MSVEAQRPSQNDNGEARQESELARVLESYLAGLEAGRPAVPDALIAAHPDLAGPLRACLKVMHLAAGLSDSSGRPVPDPDGDGITTPPGESALTMLWPRNGSSGQRILPEPPEEDILVVRRSDEALPDGAGAGRYQVLGEIARGGMGVVLKARDVDLGRDLALKVLQARHRGDRDVVGRFVEEARIGGQLQHPGIVPVHELGALSDRRPYFTMKLVKGRTLSALLAERPGCDADLPRFLSIFEQVCQALAYAHARRVIHRDLKPANVMVGSFGEVQVVDWGLAKVLPEGGVADEARAMAEETEIATGRSGPTGSDVESQPGSVLGTPSYMAPEQARGDLDRVDERADVFGLGAILCEILTGRPPFLGASRDEIRARAAQGELTDAFGRLDASGADAELIALARDCLADDPDRRPRNAGEVARRISAYQAGVQDRLRAAELARVEAQARAEEERKRRRVTVALAASIVGLFLLVGGGWTYLARQRMERAALVDRAAHGVELLYDEARRAIDDPARWIAAREAARSLEGRLGDAPDATTRDRLAVMVRDVTAAAAGAEADRTFLEHLAEIRATGEDDDPGATIKDANYAEAFRKAGMDVDRGSPDEVAAKIQARPAAVRVAIASALDDWASLREKIRNDPDGARRLTEVARRADPDPLRERLRALSEMDSRPERIRGLHELAASSQIEEWPAVSLYLLAASLYDLVGPTAAESVLRVAVRRYPGDVWINRGVARCLDRQGRQEEAIRYYTVLRSLRPEMAHDLAHALERRGESDQALDVFQDLVRRRPENGKHLTCLGRLLKKLGRKKESQDIIDAGIVAARSIVERNPDNATAHFQLGHALENQERWEEATAEYRAAIRLKPDDIIAHMNLGSVLADAGKTDEAIAECRTVIRLKPDLAVAHYNLGRALSQRGDLDEAIAEWRAAIRLKPDLALAHYNLGTVLGHQGKPDEAIAEYRAAIRLQPDDAEAHGNLGNSLMKRGDLEGAIAEYRAAIRLKPDDAKAHNNLGTALSNQGTGERAINEYREALRLRPDFAEVHYNLGNALSDQGKRAEAIAEYRQTLRLQPDFAEAHCNLGKRLNEEGRYAESLAELKRGHELGTSRPNWRYPSAQWVQTAKQLVELERRLPDLLSGKAKPADHTECLALAQMCYQKKHHGASARFWSEAFRAEPKLADDMQAQHRYNAACAVTLAGCGPSQDDPPLDDVARARWRKQAIDWLKADLTAWSKILESGPPQARAFIAQTLRHWKADPDLVGLREPGSLEKLPKDEQDACRALWKDVDALLAKTGGAH